MGTTWEYQAGGKHAGMRIELESDDVLEAIADGTIDEPIPFRLSQPGIAGGILLSDDLLVVTSVGIADILLQHNDRIVARPVSIDGVVDRRYVHLHVPEGSGPIEAARGLPLLLSMRQLSDKELSSAYGLFIDEATWDKSKVFVPRFDTEVFMTHDVAKCVIDGRFDYVECVAARLYGYDFAVSQAEVRIKQSKNSVLGMPSRGGV